MCGIAGVLDLEDRRPVPTELLHALAAAMVHRGPDEDGFLHRPGLGLVSRRLSLVGLEDGRQPISNEDGSLAVVFNGELFDYREIRSDLLTRGHHYRTHCDTEMLVHLWEDHGEDMLPRLRGQFAFALWDEARQCLTLARDRFGICPLFWTQQNGWLYFASEIKVLLQAGVVRAAADPLGIDQVFCFMAVPGPHTCFAGVQAVLPGHLLQARRGNHAAGGVDLPSSRGQAPGGRVNVRAWWQAPFPDRGHEGSGAGTPRQIEEFEALLQRAVQRRLRADVPVAVCLSGGVDSAVVAALAKSLAGPSVQSFSVQVDSPGLDESVQVASIARHLGIKPIFLRCGREELLNAYPQIIAAAEAPVMDTSCAAVLLLSRLLHEHGYKAALTGQGADEVLAGYLWFKIDKIAELLDMIPGIGLRETGLRVFARLTAPFFPWSEVRDIERAVGGWNGLLDFYGFSYLSRFRFFSRDMHHRIGGHVVHRDLGLDSARMSRWHPLNRGLHLAARTLLAGMLLSAKGDLASMASSVELRHPFLDEEVYDYCARLPVLAKLHGLTDKYLLRRVAARWLPRDAAWRRKAMFLAPRDTLLMADPAHTPPWVRQLLSRESLGRTGYFDPDAVEKWLRRCPNIPGRSLTRISVELGLTGVVSTQLWHHLFLGGGLCELPGPTFGTPTSSLPPILA